MSISYSTIYNCCIQKCNQLGIVFDFNNNIHLQHSTSLDDIYKHLVYHSQNRSQGCAINFFKAENDGNGDIAESIWSIIENYHFNLNDNFDYINLFHLFKDNESVNGMLSLEKGKDIQFLELAKTCQCIKKYLDQYGTFDEFVSCHSFSNNPNENWNIIKRMAKRIYNMSTELIPDFFKEQDCIVGREFLVKADIHVKRFFMNIYMKKLSDKQVYEILLNLYNNADLETKRYVPPYKVDKLIYLIGERLSSPEESKQFAEWVIECCNQE